MEVQFQNSVPEKIVNVTQDNTGGNEQTIWGIRQVATIVYSETINFIAKS